MVLSWWLWLLLGLVLLAVELATPGGFYFLFFGVGAMIVGLLAALGLAGPGWSQWLWFGVLSTAALVVFRRRLQTRLASPPDRGVDTMIGEMAVAIGEIGVQQIGKAELRGSVWSARNVGESSIVAGQRCRVERLEGLMLHVRG